MNIQLYQAILGLALCKYQTSSIHKSEGNKKVGMKQQSFSSWTLFYQIWQFCVD